MYLTDDDLVTSFKNCADSLTIDETTGQSGLIFVKENVKDSGAYLDKEDNCVIRNPIHFKLIWEAAGLECIHASYQPGWPKDLYDIMLWVLRKKVNVEPKEEEVKPAADAVKPEVVHPAIVELEEDSEMTHEVNGVDEEEKE